ncbi:MAG: hypothetical protein WBA74_03610, partial [Cyclobacteriaceae bacterium]
MSDQELSIQEVKLNDEPKAIPEDLDRPEKSDSEADGITVINDTGFAVSVLVHNQILGFSSSGYIASGSSLVLPAGWAWWDVYALYQNSSAHLLFGDGTIYSHKKKGMV